MIIITKAVKREALIVLLYNFCYQTVNKYHMGYNELKFNIPKLFDTVLIWNPGSFIFLEQTSKSSNLACVWQTHTYFMCTM